MSLNGKGALLTFNHKLNLKTNNNNLLGLKLHLIGYVFLFLLSRYYLLICLSISALFSENRQIVHSLGWFMELLCPAGNLSSLKVAIEYGADAIYIGLKNDTNARHFAGLNFTDKKLSQAVNCVRQHERKLHVAINTFAPAEAWQRWQYAVDLVANQGIDALIVSDLSVMQYASERSPAFELHLSFHASATNAEAINYYQDCFNIKRVVLPLPDSPITAINSPFSTEKFTSLRASVFTRPIPP